MRCYKVNSVWINVAVKVYCTADQVSCVFAVECVLSLSLIYQFFFSGMLMSCNVGACASASTTWLLPSRASAASVSLASTATRGSSIRLCLRWSLTLLWSGWTGRWQPVMRSPSPASPLMRRCWLMARSAMPQAGEMRRVRSRTCRF